MVAAIRSGAGSGQCGGSRGTAGWQLERQEEAGSGGGGQHVSDTLSHAEQARIGSGLCFNHFCYVAKAKRCEAPCTWSGN
jgi:hypothetical protein